MLILEFLSVMKPSRRREVKERLDALMKYDNSEFRARFRLSKLTVHHLPSELVCHTAHPPSFCNIIRSVYSENLQKCTTSKYRYTYEWHAMASADCSRLDKMSCMLVCSHTCMRSAAVVERHTPPRTMLAAGRSRPWHACPVGLPAPPFSQCRNSHYPP